MQPAPKPRSVAFPLLLAILVGGAAIFYWRSRAITGAVRSEATALRLENERLRRQLSELKPPSTVASRSADPVKAAPDATPVSVEPDGAVARMARLKRYCADHPEFGIPAMRLLHDEDWMEEALKGDLETELGRRLAFGMLRQRAQGESSRLVREALARFQTAHAGRSAAGPADLAPYMSQPENADLLAFYRPYGGGFALPPPAGQTWLFEEKPGVDPWVDFVTVIGSGDGWGGMSDKSIGWDVSEAIAKYTAAKGVPPQESAQLQRYLQSVWPPAEIEAVFQASKR